MNSLIPDSDLLYLRAFMPLLSFPVRTVRTVGYAKAASLEAVYVNLKISSYRKYTEHVERSLHSVVINTVSNGTYDFNHRLAQPETRTVN
jgi:hypothetical protein